MNTFKREFLKTCISQEQLHSLLNTWSQLSYQEQVDVIDEDEKFNSFNDRLKDFDLTWGEWRMHYNHFLNVCRSEGFEYMDFENGVRMTIN